MNRKRTKIVATISDRRCEPDFIRSLYEAGMDVVRINTAHQDIKGALNLIKSVRQVSDKIPFMLDTKGPEVRSTECDGEIFLKKGQEIMIVGDPGLKTTGSCMAVNYPNFANDVPVGSVILIDDGAVEMKVTGREGNTLKCLVANDGPLGSRKSVNVPNITINLPSLSDRDREYIQFAIDNDLDFIAHSFVRSASDIIDIQKILDERGSEIKIIAKIENQQGVDNLNEILDHAYGIMVARGDLAIEIPYERIPTITRKIINKCIKRRKPVIVATQMLHSMIENPRPTRAEVNDIASSIYSQTDAIMLSGETAYGKYPVESVTIMNKVALEVEKNKIDFLDIPSGNLTGEVSAYLAKIAVKTASRISARYIVCDTIRGRSVRNMASYRGINLVMAQCYSSRSMRELALSYGVYASLQEKHNSADMFIKIALDDLTNNHDINENEVIVVIAGNFSGGNGSSYIEIGSVEYLRERGKTDI